MKFVSDLIGRFGKKKQENLESGERSTSNISLSKSVTGKSVQLRL